MRGLRSILLLVALMASGCATYNVVDQINPSDEGGSRATGRDHVYDVTAAMRAEDGTVTICVTGTQAGAFFYSSSDFSITVPAETFVRAPHRLLSRFVATEEYVGGPCPATRSQSLSRATPLPIETVRNRDFGGDGVWPLSDDTLRASFAETAAPAIYKFVGPSWVGSGDFVDIVYVHDAAAVEGDRAFEIYTPIRKIDGNPAWIVLVPFAVVFDVVTGPIQLLFALTY